VYGYKPLPSMRKWRFYILLVFWVTLLSVALPPRAAFSGPLLPWSLSKVDKEIGEKAAHDVKKKRWQSAHQHAAQASDPTIGALFKWIMYIKGSSNTRFEEITQFINQNPHWPDQELLSRRVEEAMSLTTPA
jgi:soluble lytic murein transglycosylase